jgi:hypothetical protein
MFHPSCIGHKNRAVDGAIDQTSDRNVIAFHGITDGIWEFVSAARV